MPRSGPTGALRSHYDRHCRSHMFYRRVARQTITTTPRETRYSILAMPHLPLLHIGNDTIVVVKARCRSAQGKAHKILSNSLQFCCTCQDKLRSLGLGIRRMVAKKGHIKRRWWLLIVYILCILFTDIEELEPCMGRLPVTRSM